MSKGNVVLICPKIPPTRDGVGDYTYRLAEELAKTHAVTIATTEGQQPAGCNARIVTVPAWTTRGMAGLWPLLAELRPSFINVQWVPFLWGRWGVNFALPLTVLRLRRAGYRVVTTVHEPYVPFDMWRRLPMGAVQRLELAILILGSAKIAVTFSFLRDLFSRWFSWRAGDIFWLPVGSNIPRLPQALHERAEIRRSLGIREDALVVVMFHPLGAGKMLELAYKAWRAIRERQPGAKLLLIGCERQQLGSDLPSPDDVVFTGYVDPSRASRLLSSADLCLAPYIDGVSGRRGSVMAAMEHGLPILSTTGRLTDRSVFERSPLVLVDVADEAGFVREAVRLASDEPARRQLHAPTERFYGDHFSWPLIAGGLLQQCQ